MKLLMGDCLKQMQKLSADSVDAIVCDPPYGLEFMGKEWDTLGDARHLRDGSSRRKGTKWKQDTPSPILDVGGATPQKRARIKQRGVRPVCLKCGKGGSGKWGRCTCEHPLYTKPSFGNVMQEWHYRWAVEAFRVAKPGAHLVAFGGTRTFHRLTCALEDAGWEIRDCLMWLYGSGFPKSHNIDNGRGTGLKPAWEPIILARKPLSGTVASNVKKHGTGAINIDATRIDYTVVANGSLALNPQLRSHIKGGHGGHVFPVETSSREVIPHLQGRWPANVILDEEAGEMLDEQSGESISAGGQASLGAFRNGLVYGVGRDEREGRDPGFGDEGGASRFFYCAKASRAEREEGLEELESKPGSSTVRLSPTDNMTCADCGRTHPASYRGSCQRCGADAVKFTPAAMNGSGRDQSSGVTRNHHPTVKPVALMRWLCMLVTPKGGTVLDPFMGSGSTGIAARLAGFDFIGIDKDKDYIKIAKARIDAYQRYVDMATHPSLPPITNVKAEEFFE